MVRKRVLPVLVVFATTVVVTGVLTAGVYARGLAFTLGPVGALVHVPALAVLMALASVALVRVKGLTRVEAGLQFEAGDLGAFARASTATVVGLVALVFAAGALSGHPLTRGANAVSPGLLLAAFVSFVGSSAVQQVTLQSFAIAASPHARPSRGGVAFAVGMFVLAHVQVSHSPLYLANVALFALASIALFHGPRPSYALPFGFHAGWNFAQVALLAAPTGAPDANPVAPWRWPQGASLLFGGAAGLDEGLLFTVAMMPVFAVALRRLR